MELSSINSLLLVYVAVVCVDLLNLSNDNREGIWMFRCLGSGLEVVSTERVERELREREKVSTKTRKTKQKRKKTTKGKCLSALRLWLHLP
jgi:hypothetical protein